MSSNPMLRNSISALHPLNKPINRISAPQVLTHPFCGTRVRYRLQLRFARPDDRIGGAVSPSPSVMPAS
jgi:hypothetical protein